MAEADVESILREIRERVAQQQLSGASATSPEPPSPVVPNVNGGNGLQTPIDYADKLALIESYLTTTARAWDRLPPLISNRSGGKARLELWMKRHLKRATRWYAWEQVNFNAATNNALRDIVRLVSDYARELAKMHARMEAQEAQRAVMQQQYAELTATLARITAELQTQQLAMDKRSNLIDVRFADLLRELRERDAHLLEEQRVCYKQIALETTEAAVLEDRARRKNEILLQELSHRVEELEKK